ncbi:MAG: rhodanese-like domain-containing protein [Ahrensia sp.]
MTITNALTRRTFLLGTVLIVATPARADYAELTALEAAERLAADPTIVVVDIRTRREFNSGHIAGAVNINFYEDDFFAKLTALDPSKTYLVHCAVGGRSRVAERAFASAGLQNVLHMTRGIEDWRRQGLPLIRP